MKREAQRHHRVGQRELLISRYSFLASVWSQEQTGTRGIS